MNNQNRRRLALAVIALLCTGLVAQESRNVEMRFTIPLLHDLPLLDYRRQTEEKAWLPLGESTMWARFRYLESAASRPAPPPEAVGTRERWLMDLVRSRFQGLSAVETVERATVRNDGVNRTVTSEMGVEVRGSKDAVGKVRTFFDRFTAGSQKVVTIELRVLSSDELTYPDAGAAAAVASRQDYEKRLREFAAARGSRTSLHSPTIRVFANQTAQASMVEQVGYIKDYKVAVVGGQKIADPVVGVIDEGFEVELTPLYDPDGGILIISGNIGFSHVVRPIPEHRVKIGETEATVQLPSVRSNRWTGELKLEPGQDTFKITGLKHSPPGSQRDQDVEVWCLVTLVDEGGGGPKGEIVNRDEKAETVFVEFPREAVPDEPWAKAPKEVSVYRGDEKIGTARLAGGWVYGAGDQHPVIAIYRLAEGTPRDGDSVR